jgi:hypothetical protein
MEGKNQGKEKMSPSLVESSISVTRESPCGQVDPLLGSRLLRPR